MAASRPPSPPLVDLTLRVPAMDCADEVALVRQALEGDPGVAHLGFDLVHGQVTLALDPARTSEAAVRAAIERTGLAVVADTPSERAGGRSARLRAIGMADVLASGALFAVGWTIDGLHAHSWQEAIFGSGGREVLAHAHAPGAVPAYAGAVVAGLWRMWPRAVAALRHRRLDMHVLICLSAAGAAAIGQWAEAAAVACLFAVAHRLEAWSLERARDALASAGRLSVAADGPQSAAPVERWIERFATVYTPAVTLAAALVALGPPLLDGHWSMWFYRALVFLVMACPCALVISTPVTVVAAVTALARDGLVVKGGAALELASTATRPSEDALERAGLVLADTTTVPAAAAHAHVIFVQDGDRDVMVARLVAHSRRAVAVIRQNVAVSLVTKGAFLASALLGSAPLWLAVLADTGATLVVTLNGLRLLRLTEPR